jgi:hypothetical protein
MKYGQVPGKTDLDEDNKALKMRWLRKVIP